MSSAHDIEAVPAAFIDAWNRHDAQALAALFTEDANFVNVVGMWWKNRAQIQAAHAATHESIFKDSQLKGDIARVAHLSPGVTAVHVAWELKGQTEPDGTPGDPRQGIMLLILTDERDGGWRIKIAQNTDIVPGVTVPPRFA